MTMNVSNGHTAFEFPYVVSDTQLKASAILNFILGAVSLLAFISMRGTLRSVGGVYQRRRELTDLFLQPPQLLLGGLRQAWSWATSVMCMSDTDIVRTAGFDALLLNRTILMGLQIFSVLTVLALGILLPTYYSFDDVVTHRLHRGTNVAELSRTTISNLPPGHAILWLPAAATYLVIAYCCWVLLVHCQSYAELRMAYMLCLDAAGAQHYQQPDRKPPRRQRTPHSSGGGGGGGPRGAHTLEGCQKRDEPAAAAAVSMPCSTFGSSASLQHLLGTEAAGLVGQAPPRPGSFSMTWSRGSDGMVALPPIHTRSHSHSHSHSHSTHVTGLHRHDPHGPAAECLRPNLSSSSLQAAAAGLPVTVSVGPAAQRAAGLARMSYDPAAVGPAAAEAVAAEVAPRAPYAPGSMPLRVRLRLVAPWLRHVVISAVERAERSKAADNLLAWVNPLRMLAKDREDWARQQLAADVDPDPSLPPVASGRPPADTAVYGGLLVASEDMLMALTGRAEDVMEPESRWRRSGGHRAHVDWSESVRELAKSLGIWLGPGGGGDAKAKATTAAPGCSHRRGGVSGGGSRGGGCGISESGGSACGGESIQGESASASGLETEGGAKQAAGGLAASAGAGSSGGSQACQIARGKAAGDDSAPTARKCPGVGAGSGAGAAGNTSKSRQSPPVYRYWAPSAEQRCFCRDLRRRQRRQAPWQQGPRTPLGFESMTNPVFDALAVDSTGGSADASGGGGGCVGLGRPYGVARVASRAQDDAGGVSKGSRGGAAGGGSGGGGGNAAAEPGSCATTPGPGRHRMRPGDDGGSCDELAGQGNGEEEEEEDGEGGDGDRPWTGWQQQPLAVGRCNARLRQLMKVRHGGRSHLVNCHHYAVLIRDVVLRPVERFNLIGMPVLRSSTEGGAGGGGGEHYGGDRAPRRYVRGDIEWGDGDGACARETREEAAGDGGGSGHGGLPRPRRHRPLLQPPSDLPLRDRAVLMVRELRNPSKHNDHHDRQRKSVRTPGLDGGGVAAAASAAGTVDHMTEVPYNAKSVELSTAFTRRSVEQGEGTGDGDVRQSEDKAPLPGPPDALVPWDDSEEAAAVAAYYTQLFPDSFQRLVPVCSHRAVDELLFQWTAAMGNLAGALLAAHVAVRSTAADSSSSLPSGTAGSSSTAAAACATAAIRRAAAAVRRLQDRILLERARALRSPTRRAYIALFSSQRDAAVAAQCSPLAPPSRAQPLHFRACAAPPPDSVYWPALWTLPTGRAARLLASLPLLAVLVFPIGVLTGALANLPVAVCGGTPQLNALYWPWFCNRRDSHSLYARLARSLLTGLLPALISLGWNAWVLPMVLYLLSAIQSRCVSLPAMDRQMSRWFFWWSLLNMFLGAVVGGGMFQQLGAYLQDPGKLLLRIGTALPTASNFFMHYTLTKGLYSNWLRVAWPHLGSMAGAIMRGGAGAALPSSWQDVFLIHTPPGYRFSSFYNGVFQVTGAQYRGSRHTLMVGLAYVVTAPLIAPIALLFFITAYITWRYAIVYIFERQYESGGQMFPVVFSHMTGYLLVGELFTGAVLLTNGGWMQAALLWCSLTPAIVAFHRLCVKRYLRPLEHPPLSLAMAAPPASVDSSVYLPPALREGSVGWYPESGKVWEQYGIPKYVI
ncbi:hypothetical protein VOLCADRAFT_89203 [Volvox carteri f. nagariensis]|uniref:ERD4-related membrane protein n=1 Tax=Volvox carteri f. nagariensis TaxID=3068 RepID=D8TR26_VOLCA|nr:uncharacterized protein VOLCADRAFT_89203 [Volvox carteri f. nagariensis]EFJ50262.1 hypothetical protein VOLCADRAFT_89203 [Volvox carteri f. nagariensis]|eukprot:XP_002948882.1 hypothetical protein VOLCADRAFT_89203 [Volvox carteri f. nagariensis]